MKKDLKSKLEKVVINSGIGRLSQTANFNDKVLPAITEEFTAIVGQKPILCPAKKSIAGFKIREGNIVGIKVTLRGVRMMDFLTRLTDAALPRVRDFRGVSKKAVDEHGNLTIGLKEHIVFPEITAETSKVNFGMEVTIVPKIKDKESAMNLYKELKIPFEKQENKKA